MTSTIREMIEALPSLDEAMEDTSGDEIAEALARQLDVLEGTTVLLGNVLNMLHLQIANLRAEVALLDQPVTVAAPVEKPEVKQTARGAIVESSMPKDRQLPGFCGHPDALRVPTTDGHQIVCPDCDDD